MLKKLIAILLLAIHLFNLGGYSLVFRYFIHQSEQQFIQQLDQDQYKDADLVEISIPLHLPYMQNSSGFERIDGSVENNSILYNYVKRRVYNDTLYILAIPNRQKTQLVKEKSNYAGEANDFAANKKEKESTAKKTSLTTEYNNTINQYSFLSPAATASASDHSPAFLLLNTPAGTPEHPPQSAC